MSAIVFVELEESVAKKSSLEAVSYAAKVDGETIAVVFGELSSGESAIIGGAGATQLMHVQNEKYAQPNIMAYATALAEAMEKTQAKLMIMSKSSLADAVSARVAIKTDAALISNVAELPDTSNGFTVKRSIYTGKAFALTSVESEKIVLTIKKNAVPLKEGSSEPTIEAFEPTNVSDQDFSVKVTSQEKATGDVLLPEADIVVSGGRGLKGPENWGIIEDLAKALGAATGCSKPVSDMDWRPHHEHVGQTGVKVAPSLYVAVGISGAIQHLAGVNSSKYILVINKDAEAPFFKAADYGIVGDAFEVLPKLTEAIKAS